MENVYISHIISTTLPSTYQNLLKFMEIWRSSDRNKNAQFFETRCIQHIHCEQKKEPFYILLEVLVNLNFKKFRQCRWWNAEFTYL